MEHNERETLRRLLEAALEKLNARPGEAEPASNTGHLNGPLQSITPAAGHCAATTPHAGLERFTIIETDSNPTGAKPCFMEPSRVCVNSGACEMRGF